MSIKIFEWSEIKQNYGDALLIGNGASIAISNNFNYKSLKEFAVDEDFFTDDIKEIFDKFETDDFELILRLLYQTNTVNTILGIEDSFTNDAYIMVRNVLIRIIRDIHPEYEDVRQQLPFIANFLKGFKTVFSLNYDLILYWAIMHANETDITHAFKDCFVRKNDKLLFETNWRKFSKPLGRQEKSTLVFYLHGNLILAKSLYDQIEEKINTNISSNLLETILNQWESENIIPLFVSEGRPEEKIISISNSSYLSSLYQDVLINYFWQSNLAIYGWSFGDSDMHILKQMFDYGRPTFCKNIAISVYGNDTEAIQSTCHDITSKIYKIPSLKNTNLQFFRSESRGCWNNSFA